MVGRGATAAAAAIATSEPNDLIITACNSSSTCSATAPEAVIAAFGTGSSQFGGIARAVPATAGAFASSLVPSTTDAYMAYLSVAFLSQPAAPPPQTVNVIGNAGGTVTSSGALTLSKIIVGGGGNDIESSAEMVALGDMIYGGVGGMVQGLSGNTTTTPKYLSQTGTGSASAAPTWQPAPAGSVTTKGDLLGYDTAPDRIPVGSNGQVLTADSTQALGLKWAAGGGGSSPLTTKGDVYGYSSTDARIPVGSDGQVLTADSTQPLGVKWATGGGVPTLRGSAILAQSASSFTLTFPAGTIAGDFAVLFAASGQYVNSVSGWTPIYVWASSGDWWNGGIASKILTATDISTGSVTVTMTGSTDGVVALATFVGPTGGISQVNLYQSPGSSGSSTINLTSGNAGPSDYVLLFGSNRASSTDTCNVGSQLQTATGGGSASLYSYTPSSAVTPTATFSYSSAGSGNFQAIVMVAAS